MDSFASFPSPSSVFAAYASISASVMLFRTTFNQIVPPRLQDYLLSTISSYFTPRSCMITVLIEERDGITNNDLFDAAETYLCSKISPEIGCLKLLKRPKDSNITTKLAKSEKIVDVYEGIHLHWRFICEKSHGDSSNDRNGVERRYFELIFEEKQKEIVLNSYVPFVLQEAKNISDSKKKVKLHTLSNAHSYPSIGLWDSVNLEHPSTFETIALDPSLKKAIMEDLDRFVGRREFYRKVGKAWKRGYLLYGPPGTGKSSLIAAMANYLKFDIYDLELGNIQRDSDLRKLLLRTSNRSILVIEDIDCSVKLPGRKGRMINPNIHRVEQFTLSGLLNFIDGLWSSCGDERIIIFTTNNKDKLDPALLRPGRMDMHIHMSYLTTHGFRVLASNYLDVPDHHIRYREIEGLIEGVEVTPAEVAEELMKNDAADADASLEGVVRFLKRKKMEMDEKNNRESREREVPLPKRSKKDDCRRGEMKSLLRTEMLKLLQDDYESSDEVMD